jgi:predicted nucleic acid-binding protein
MIVLDTSVISELMLESPSPRVKTCLKRYDAAELHITSITLVELHYGLQVMPAGRCRENLTKRAALILSTFADRVLAFDAAAASHYVEIATKYRTLGHVVPIFDAQVAAIALSRQATVMTRNIRDFEISQVPVIHPWEDAL